MSGPGSIFEGRSQGGVVGQRRGRGDGGIYQRADGSWVGQLDLGWVNGKRTRKYVRAQTRSEVVKRMRQLAPVIESGAVPTPEHLTVERYLGDWLTKRIPGVNGQFQVPAGGHKKSPPLRA